MDKYSINSASAVAAYAREQEKIKLENQKKENRFFNNQENQIFELCTMVNKLEEQNEELIKQNKKSEKEAKVSRYIAIATLAVAIASLIIGIIALVK